MHCVDIALHRPQTAHFVHALVSILVCMCLYPNTNTGDGCNILVHLRCVNAWAKRLKRVNVCHFRPSSLWDADVVADIDTTRHKAARQHKSEQQALQ